MIFACYRSMNMPPLDRNVEKKQSHPTQRGTSTRLFWVLGLMVGIFIGVVAAFGLAAANAAPGSTIVG